MTNQEVKFDADLAQIYDETRPIDRDACRACFCDALKGIVGNKDAKIADVGCGTGRILECLIPDLFQKEQVVGVDVSAAMLQVATGKQALRGVKFEKISAADFAERAENHHRFDAVICHWLFHCTSNWHVALSACAGLVKQGGFLIWLEEDGDLYRALDGKKSDQSNSASTMLNPLFAAYYALVNEGLSLQGLARLEPSERAGVALRSTDILTGELAAHAWKIQTHSKCYRWTKRVTVGWVIHMILEHRAFTNLRRIPPAINTEAINNLKRKLGCAGLPAAHVSLELEFWAKLVIAMSSLKEDVGISLAISDSRGNR